MQIYCIGLHCSATLNMFMYVSQELVWLFSTVRLCIHDTYITTDTTRLPHNSYINRYLPVARLTKSVYIAAFDS